MHALLRRFLPLLVPALALASTAARADDSKPGAPPATKKMDNPQYADWSRFKVGAYVEMTTESDASGTKTTAKMTTKMIELAPEKLVLETTIVNKFGNQEMALPATKTEVPKTIEVPDVKMPGVKPENVPKVTEGSETIEVAGKKVECTTTELTMDVSGMKVTSKTWRTKDIPGAVAKTTSKTEGLVGGMKISSASTSLVTKFGTGA